MNYREFLEELISSFPMKGHGIRSALAQKIGCQSTYVSRVLKGGTEFSLEQAEKIAEYFGFSEKETNYFFLLIQKEKAGTKSLKEHFKKQIDQERSQRLLLKQRLKVEEPLSDQDKLIYYSSWIYSAVHVLLTIKECQNKNVLADSLGVSPNKIVEILSFLEKTGLAIKDGSSYYVGKAQIHLPNDSMLIVKHHQNWRLQAVSSIEKHDKEDLHYSSVITLSREDAYRIKEDLIQKILEVKKRIKNSNSELAYGFSMDFFTLLK